MAPLPAPMAAPRPPPIAAPRPAPSTRADGRRTDRPVVGVLCLTRDRRFGELLAAGLIVCERLEGLSRARHDLHGRAQGGLGTARQEQAQAQPRWTPRRRPTSMLHVRFPPPIPYSISERKGLCGRHASNCSDVGSRRRCCRWGFGVRLRTEFRRPGRRPSARPRTGRRRHRCAPPPLRPAGARRALAVAAALAAPAALAAARCQACVSSPRKLRAPPRWCIAPARTGRSICGSAASPRHRPCGPCAEIARRRPPAAR